MTFPEATPGCRLTFTAAELMAEELAPVRSVLDGILPEGLHLLAGRPKIGKSWLAMGLSLSVALGDVALGTTRSEQGAVLYLALEDNKRRLQRRLGKVLAGGAAPEALHIATDWPRADEGGLGALRTWLGEHPDARLVVIDTFARFKPRSSRRRTAYDEDRDAVDPLIPVAAEHGVCVLLVHHLREMESEDPWDMITGSTGLIGGVDGALVMKRRRGQADAYLHVDGRDIENPKELALSFDADAATWSVVGNADEYRMGERRRAVLRALKGADGPLGPKEITDVLASEPGTDASYGAVRELLSQMVKDGQARNLGRGLYVHPDNADKLTTGSGDVSLSGSSGQPKNGAVRSGGR